MTSIIAFSGGVDSLLLLADQVDAKTRPVLLHLQTGSPGQLAAVQALASRYGARLCLAPSPMPASQPIAGLVHLAAALALAASCTDGPAEILLGSRLDCFRAQGVDRHRLSQHLALVVSLFAGGRVDLRYPLLDRTDQQRILLLRNRRRLLPSSWSCDTCGTRHCGRCTGCRRRHQNFAAAGLVDPTEYLEPPGSRHAFA